MLTNLRIKNFRMLEDLEIPKLGRVNLIVGKNNSGKSTLLESLRICNEVDLRKLLREILREHDESFDLDQEVNIDNQEQSWYGLKNLFPDRKFPSDSRKAISISSNEKNIIKIEYVFYYINDEFDTDEDGNVIGVSERRVYIDQSKLSGIDETSEINSALRITLESGRIIVLDLAEDGRRFFISLSKNSPKCSYVSTDFISPERLADLWDNITFTPAEDTVLKSLRIIDKNIERLAFIKNNSKSAPREAQRLAIIKLRNSESRIPLNSMGDGMSRILQLILSIFPAKNGILLIDEFENGLHYSVQEEVWRIIFKLAEELNIQVFATTHSWDCIESFTKAAIENQEDGVLLKISRSKLTSDHGKVIVTVYDEAELQTITASELEIR